MRDDEIVTIDLDSLPAVSEDELMLDPGDRLLRVKDLQDRLGISRSTLYNRLNAGELPTPRKFGGSLVWLESEFDEWLENLPLSE